MAKTTAVAPNPTRNEATNWTNFAPWNVMISPTPIAINPRNLEITLMAPMIGRVVPHASGVETT